MVDNEKIIYNKICIVPECKSTSLATPNKLFIAVPKKPEARKQWHQAIRQYSPRHIKNKRYCCEDHFKLPKDMENVLSLKDMKNFSVRVKPGVVPHIFDCCKNQKIQLDVARNITLEGRIEDVSRKSKNKGVIQRTGAAKRRPNMDSTTIPSNSNKLGIQIPHVYSVTHALQNFIEYEVDVNDLEEKLISGDFLQHTSKDLVVEPIECSEEIQMEQNVQDQQIDEISTEEIGKEICQDSDDDTFEKEINLFKETDKVDIVQQQPIDIISDDESLNDKNFKGSKDVNFRFLTEKELLEECIVVDISDDTEEQHVASCEENQSVVAISPEIDSTRVNEVELTSSDDNDCIILSEDDNLSNSDMHSKKSEKNTGKLAEEVTEADILKEFDIIDEEDDDDDDICIESEGSQNSKKIIRRKNLVYSCPFNCTFLASNRQLFIEHLINHKIKSQQKVYRCPLCPFHTGYKRVFVKHVFYHEGPRFACKKCSYVTKKPSLLKTHMMTSHGMTVFCETCSKFKTRQVGYFFAHQMQCPHNQSKRDFSILQVAEDHFGCHFDPCPFTTTSEEALKTHEWIQHQVGSNNIKKFKCYIDYCGFETFREEIFQDHINKHPGCELRCRQCSYKTLDWKKFKDHIIRHVTSSGTAYGGAIGGGSSS